MKGKMENKTSISAPWYEYQRKLQYFFAGDDDVEVLDLEEGSEGYVLPVVVTGAEKAFALQKVLKPFAEFGGVTVEVDVRCEDIDYILDSAFADNNLVKNIVDGDYPGSTARFVELSQDVIQFFNDDISSPAGVSTFLPETVARETFDVLRYNAHFCTSVFKGA